MKIPFYCLIIGVLTACQSLPDLSPRTPSLYIPTHHSPRLETALQLPKQPSDTPPNAYIYVLDHAHDAFAARAALAENAMVSLDVRYYIWHNDVSGSLLMRQLWQAAERGVRVRLLLDDNNTRGLDPILSILHAHPKIEVRLFNPFLNRKWRALGYLKDFPRVNRRMHNKSFTADNRASIIGGRNVGDEYFSHHADTAFSDMDVLVSGQLVTDVSEDFDKYWRSQSAYPIDFIVKKINKKQLAAAQETLFAPLSPKQIQYLDDVQQYPFAQAQVSGSLKYLPTQSELISDNPAKALDKIDKKNQAERNQSVRHHLQAALKNPERELYIVSPYFVPTQTGVDWFGQLRDKGVDITVFTNSLKATDVSAVHSGYARYREPLLRSGVQLYEFKQEQAVPKQTDKGLTGSTTTSLHAKTFIVDKERVYVGSLNFDPRSVLLNTEMGVVIHNASLASQMQQQLQQNAQQTAYHVHLSPKQTIQWHDPQTQETSEREPEAGFWKRTISRILSILPIERLLW